MKVLVIAASLLLAAAVADPALAQTPPAGSRVTRDLNSGPPAPAGYIPPARPAATAAPSPSTTTATPPRATPPASATPLRATATPAAPATTTPAARPSTAPATARPATPAPAGATPRPTSTAPAAATRPAATSPSGAGATPATAPVAAPNPPPAPPNVPAVTVLNASARAALPFTVDLPAGFEIVTGRPGPDFKIYTIRRGGKSFAMVYAGPASQFPIYSGEMVQAGGRSSVVSVEGSQRHAMEHLFQRPETAGAPREVHVWTMSLDGADRALAERIAQSVDVR